MEIRGVRHGNRVTIAQEQGLKRLCVLEIREHDLDGVHYSPLVVRVKLHSENQTETRCHEGNIGSLSPTLIPPRWQGGAILSVRVGWDGKAGRSSEE